MKRAHPQDVTAAKQPRRAAATATLARAVALVVAGMSAAHADALESRLVADGTHEAAVPPGYATTADGAAGYALHALNSGTITAAHPLHIVTSGASAAAVVATDAGHITLSGGDIATTGAIASGLLVTSGGKLHMAPGIGDPSRVSTQGRLAAAVIVDAGTARLWDTHLETAGDSAPGLVARSGAAVTLQNGSIRTQATSADGMRVDTGAHVDLFGTAVHALGNSASALRIGATGSIEAQGVSLITDGLNAGTVSLLAGSRLLLKNSRIETNGDRGWAIQGGGDVDLSNTPVQVHGVNTQAILLLAGSLRAQGGEIRATHRGSAGIELGRDVVAVLEDLEVSAGRLALNFGGAGGDATLDRVGLHTADTAVRMATASALRMTDGSISTTDDKGVAIDNRAGTVHLVGTALTTAGQSAHVLYASMEGGRGRPVFTADAVDITSTGVGSIGAVARLGGQITLRDSAVSTFDEKAYGVLAGGSGYLALHNTTVATEGEGAFAAVVNDNGQLDIDGGALSAERAAALWVRSARQMTVRNGAQLRGGNGALMQVDAAFAAPFHVVFDQDVKASGDIITTPEDIGAGIPVEHDVHLALQGRSHWRGASAILRSVALADDSQWTLTGDSQVGALALDNSRVQLSEGYAGRFHRLTVDGDLSIHNSLLVFNGQLGDDGSLTDILHVRGDTTGSGAVQVNNVGGVGDETYNGIRLIQVDGHSGADFVLRGRAVAGTYEYFLHKGGAGTPGDGHWYLRSEMNDSGNPCDIDPNAPGCTPVAPPPEDCTTNPALPGCGTGPTLPDPCEVDGQADCRPEPPRVLRPEAGAYLANQAAAQRMFMHARADRGPRADGATGVRGWSRVEAGSRRQNPLADQLSLRTQQQLTQIGADVGVFDENRGRVGLMLGAGRATSTARSQLSGYAARGRVRGVAAGVYGGWQNDRAYVDGSLQRGRFRNQVQGDGLAGERYDSRLLKTALEAGYRFDAGRIGAATLSLQPELQVVHTRASMGTHVERNGTIVRSLGQSGVATRLGLRLQSQMQTGTGTRIAPYLQVNGYRDGTDNGMTFDAVALEGPSPKTRVELTTGAQLQFNGGWRGWAGAGVTRGERGYREANAQMGVAYHW